MRGLGYDAFSDTRDMRLVSSWRARGSGMRMFAREPVIAAGSRYVSGQDAYAILDPILQFYVEENRSIEEIVDAGFDRATVARVVAMVDGSEFKRRQAPIGIKVTHRAFGKDCRMPITNGYRNS
ncbi:MAG: hypothetical protein HP493_01500 [Nitrospira sp.]|nr:hypothetical protein [Nitrospira sp.]